MLIELRQAFILYQDYHMLLLTPAGEDEVLVPPNLHAMVTSRPRKLPELGGGRVEVIDLLQSSTEQEVVF